MPKRPESVTLPFFDLASSTTYLTELLSEAQPPFASVAIVGEYAAQLANQLREKFANVSAAEQSADVMISWDVVHQLPKDARRAYVARLANLAKRELLIVCPLGTELQTLVYRSLSKLAHEQKLEVPAEIKNAVLHGLPTPQDAANWAHGFPDLDLLYAGDVAFFQEQATQFIARASLNPVRKLWHSLAAPVVPASGLEAPLPPETVPMRRHRRLYLLIRKG